MSVGVAVLASGDGTNLQALLHRFRDDARVHIRLVISDRASAGALGRAESAGIRRLHVPVAARGEDAVALDLLDALAAESIDLIALAGYLRLVPAPVIEQYRHRIINIHPALLPAFGGRGMYGAHVHAAVLAAGCKVSGATVHFVDERFDEGTIIAQWPVPVLPGDSAESLGARVLRVEHRLYPACLAAVAHRLHTGAVPQRTTRAGAAGDLFRLSTADTDIETDMSTLAGL